MAASRENPFPGMNPFLEQRWGDVHTALIAYSRDLLQDRLPDELRARMQERVLVESEDDDLYERSFYPDVHVFERQSGRSSGTALAEADPWVIHLPQDLIKHTYLEIIDAHSGGRVITIVEFLSPSNKIEGAGRRLYLQKQDEAQSAGVNLVEVDLLRGGLAATLAKPDYIDPHKRTPYHVSVFRAMRPWQLEYYPGAMRAKLPTVRIPLRPRDMDISLDLQELINLCYRRGRYDDIDYTKPLRVPLTDEDAAWAREVVERTQPPT